MWVKTQDPKAHIPVWAQYLAAERNPGKALFVTVDAHTDNAMLQGKVNKYTMYVQNTGKCEQHVL